VSDENGERQRAWRIVRSWTLTTEERNEEAIFNMEPDAKLLFEGNVGRLPEIPDDDAVWEKLLRLDFTTTIPVEERIRGFVGEVLTTESAGVFAWLVEGWMRLSVNRRFTRSPGAVNASRAWRLASSSLSAFVEMWVETAPGDPRAEPPVAPGFIRKDEFRQEYVAFCVASHLAVIPENVAGRKVPDLMPGVHDDTPRIGEERKKKDGTTEKAKVHVWRGMKWKGDSKPSLQDWQLPDESDADQDGQDGGDGGATPATGARWARGEYIVRIAKMLVAPVAREAFLKRTSSGGNRPGRMGPGSPSSGVARRPRSRTR
jgi:hypothetical protein